MGYAAVEVIEKAPACLTESLVEASMESFQHVMASCGFTSQPQHTGNAARPWEYRESLRSMVSLDFETAGYDLTQRRIAYGDYFDKDCFCNAFRVDSQAESCQGQGLASTKERLWLNATCGPDFLPSDWTTGLQTTPFTFIPTKDWRWPNYETALPRRISRLADHCTADACERDPAGYCKVERAVNRACFCRGISYEDCHGPCQDFEARIDYVNWLHNICGSVGGWHGLPKHWRKLAAPAPTDMIPWRWGIKTSRDLGTGHGHSKYSARCPSTEWKLGSIVLINLASLLTALYIQTPASKARTSLLQHPATPPPWFVSGLAIALLHLLTAWTTATLVGATAGPAVPVFDLTLLWSTLPRLTWLSALLPISNPSQVTPLHTISSCLLAETILQSLSALPMLQTVRYGLEHSFYSALMARLDAAPAAQSMYGGAALWLGVVVTSAVVLLQLAREAASEAASETDPQTNRRTDARPSDALNASWTRIEDLLAHHIAHTDHERECEPLLHSPAQTYGTLAPSAGDMRVRRRMARLTIVTLAAMFLLWIAQWLFWAGFIHLSAETYVCARISSCGHADLN
jgi:hypothetical protein